MAFILLDCNSSPEVAENLLRIKASTLHCVTYKSSDGNTTYSSSYWIDGDKMWVGTSNNSIPGFSHWSLTPYGEPFSGWLVVDNNIVIYAVLEPGVDVSFNFTGYTMTVGGNTYTDSYVVQIPIDTGMGFTNYVVTVPDDKIFAGWVALSRYNNFQSLDSYYWVNDAANFKADIVDATGSDITITFTTGATDVHWADGTNADKTASYSYGADLGTNNDIFTDKPIPSVEGLEFGGWILNSNDGTNIYYGANDNIIAYHNMIATPSWISKEG